MSRAVTLDHKFDKKEFARLLAEAKGSRTQADFAHDCSISLSHLSRYINEKKEAPPTPATICQIAQAAQNGVTSDALLTAAGYDPKKHSVSRDRGRQDVELEKKANLIFSIVSNLTTCDFTWKTIPAKNLVIKNNIGQTSFDFGITIKDDDELLSEWYFTCRELPGGDDWNLLYTQAVYGVYAMFSLKPKTKISIVVASEEEAAFIKSCPPLLYPVYVSVIWVDLDHAQIIEETYLQSALDVPERLNEVYRLED